MESRGNFAVVPKDLPYAISSNTNTSPSDGKSFVTIVFANHFTVSANDSADTRFVSTTSKPCSPNHFICSSLELLKSTSGAFTSENAKKCTFLSAVILLLSCLTLPLHRFRGFLYLASTSSISAFIFSKSEYLITASPRSTNVPL